MADVNLYLKCVRNAEVQAEDVLLKDIASLQCADKTVSIKCKTLKIHCFKKNAAKRCVISVLKIISDIEKACPGVSVQNIGEADILIELVKVPEKKGIFIWAKIVLVSLVSFFGTAFTIIAFHNDISINKVFDELYEIFLIQRAQSLNVLEISYSIGLALGIIVFFNHIGKRRITNSPTPIEVAMRKYETDVDMTIIETADRQGEEIDV